MRRVIFRTFSLVVVAAVLLCAGMMEWMAYDRTLQMLETSSAEMTAVLAEAVEGGKLSDALGSSASARVTVIEKNGTVSFDSEADQTTLENHADRPEVVEAVRTGHGSALRQSATFGEQCYYDARRLGDGRVIRVMYTMKSFWNFLLSGLAPAISVITLLILGAVLATDALTRRIVGPLNRIDPEHPLAHQDAVYDELMPLLKMMDRQNKDIQKGFDELLRQRQDYMAITEHMRDGLIVTDTENILSVNKAAQRLFNVTPDMCIGRDVGAMDKQDVLTDAFLEARRNQACEHLWNRGGYVYRLQASPVHDPVTDGLRGVVILIVDITDQARAESLRREFTANVSHELKTPLMSISGYAELIQTGMAAPDVISDFAGRIHAEASRLQAMVEDILKLSRLEESPRPAGEEEVRLDDLCADVAEALTGLAAVHHVSVTLNVMPVTLKGTWAILYELVYNLVDNAIKYNVEGGSVTVSLTNDTERAVLEVRDTGIGIDPDDQKRVFERFYRADKSRSAHTGGTGLGLSIVKHAAMVHQASVELQSVRGKGTLIRVTFPKASGSGDDVMSM